MELGWGFVSFSPEVGSILFLDQSLDQNRKCDPESICDLFPLGQSVLVKSEISSNFDGKTSFPQNLFVAQISLPIVASLKLSTTFCGTQSQLSACTFRRPFCGYIFQLTSESKSHFMGHRIKRPAPVLGTPRRVWHMSFRRVHMRSYEPICAPYFRQSEVDSDGDFSSQLLSQVERYALDGDIRFLEADETPTPMDGNRIVHKRATNAARREMRSARR